MAVVGGFRLADVLRFLARVAGARGSVRGLVLAATAGSRDGVVSRHLNRRLSRRITRRLLDTPVTPDQVSLLSFALAAASAGALARGSLALGGLLAQFSSVLDGCDGELARARVETSPGGQVLDAVLDR